MLKKWFGTQLDVGSKAPEFRLPDQNGAVRSLSENLGKWVVLYFYPKDETPGCTAEACSFRDEFAMFQNLNAVVMGVSTDSIESHAKFASSNALQFSVLSDSTKETCKNYGVLNPLGFANRVTFLIDPKGVIRDVLTWVSWSTYGKTVQDRLVALQK